MLRKVKRMEYSGLVLQNTFMLLSSLLEKCQKSGVLAMKFYFLWLYFKYLTHILSLRKQISYIITRLYIMLNI